MKTVVNAVIKDARVCLSSSANPFCWIRIKTSNDSLIEWSFDFQKACDLAKLVQLLDYTNVGYDNVNFNNELKGKALRVVVQPFDKLYALGDPVKDIFFKREGNFELLTEKEIVED